MKWKDAKEIIINNQMNYNDFSKYFNVSVNQAIKIFQHLDLKKCSKKENCVNGSVQSRKNFYNQKNTRDNLSSQCIYCQKRTAKQYYYDNQEHYKQRRSRHHYENQEYYRQKNHEYYKHNKNNLKQQAKQYYYNNQEYYKQNRIQHYYKNQEYNKRKNYEYYKNNKEYMNKLSQKHYYDNKNYYNYLNKKYNYLFAKYNTYINKLAFAEKIQRDPNNLELLQVKCTYCNSWFNPTNGQVQARINALEGNVSSGAENRFYCSDECKKSCPIFKRITYSRDDTNRSHIGTSREVQSELRQLVFERDNWTCQKCNTYKDDLADGISLHCHHVEGIKHEPIKSADINMCITVCSECHKEIHKIPGCTYQDMQCSV